MHFLLYVNTQDSFIRNLYLKTSPDRIVKYNNSILNAIDGNSAMNISDSQTLNRLGNITHPILDMVRKYVFINKDGTITIVLAAPSRYLS